VKLADEFAARALSVLDSTDSAAAVIGRRAWDISDAMMAERASRRAVALTDPRSTRHSLGDWPSFSEGTERLATKAAESLIQEGVDFHVKIENDKWIFTVFDSSDSGFHRYDIEDR